MDYKFIRPAAKAAVVVIIFYMAYVGTAIALNAIDKSLYSNISTLYAFAGVIFYIASKPLLGFLSAYFHKGANGRLTIADCILTASAAVLFQIFLGVILCLAFYALLFASSYGNASRPWPSPDASYILFFSIFVMLFALIVWFFLDLLVSLIGAWMGAGLGAILLTNTEEKERWGIKTAYIWVYISLVVLLVMGLLLFLVLLWQFGPTVPHTEYVTTGWSKLQPLTSSVYYTSDGNFNASFMNAVGVPIRIDQAEANETFSGSRCSLIYVDGLIPGTTGRQTVKAGDTFRIDAVCPGKNPGDAFDLVFFMEYTAVASGIETKHQEAGHIKGVTETLSGANDINPSGCSGFAQVRPVDWRAKADGSLSMTIMNDAGTKIHLNNVSVSGSNDHSCPNLNVNRDMLAGEVLALNIAGCEFPAVGEYHRANILISYKNLASGIDHASVGECHGVVEKSAPS